jgi:Cu/Ag efflux protein CusF
VLDQASQSAFNAQLKANLRVADAHEEHPAATVIVQTQAPAPAAHHTVVHAAAHPAPAAAPAKKKWPVIAGVVVGLLLVGFLGWYFAGGGREIIANFGIEVMEGNVVKVDVAASSFTMSREAISSGWQVAVSPKTTWINVRGLAELKSGDRISLRYKEDDGKYEAVQVTVKQRIMAGTIGSLIDKTKGMFSLQDSKLAGAFVELTSEFDEKMRGMAGTLKPGDVVETVYAVGADGKNMVTNIVVRERTVSGPLTLVDPATRTLAVRLEDQSELRLTAQNDVEFKGVEGWAALAVSDQVKVAFKPKQEISQQDDLHKVEMLVKYVPPPVVLPPPPPPPKPKPAIPRVLKDVIYSTDDVVGRFQFVFNRKPEYLPQQVVPGQPFFRVILPVKSASSEYPKSEIYLSTGPIRTVRMMDEGGDLMITFLASKGVTPRCSFESEGERITALCFKN